MTAFADPESATILTRTVTSRDSLGNPVYSTVEVATSGAFAPAGSSELVQGQDTVLDHDTLYLSDGAPVPAATDQIRVRGVVYEVDGKPLVFVNPFTGDQPGPVLRLLRVTG